MANKIIDEKMSHKIVGELLTWEVYKFVDARLIAAVVRHTCDIIARDMVAKAVDHE